MNPVIKVESDVVGSAVGFSGPVLDGLKGFHWIGDNSSKTAKDFSEVGVGVINGAPSYSAGYATFGPAGGLDLDMIDTASMTMAVAFRGESTWADKPVVVGARTVNVPMNLVYISNLDKLIYRIYDAANSLVGVTTSPAFSGNTNWNMLFASVDDVAGQIRLYIPAQSINLTASYTGPRKIIESKINAGKDGAAAFVGQIKQAHAAVWSRALSVGEMDEHYEYVQAKLSALASIDV
ncbi:hypothetical protein AB4876_09540 [Zhongshania guokunii]|uniref:Uncharacterized protein n=1 Tax=Zhongshania guokunii TaxID=641783 RepID=A0ABV3U6P1_9GAMM